MLYMDESLDWLEEDGKRESEKENAMEEAT